MQSDIYLKINTKEDRQLIAGVLVKNGYTVRQVKMKQEGKNAWDYCLHVRQDKDNLDSK